MLRIPLAIACLVIAITGHCAAAITADDISLMLRSGISSKEILEDIVRQWNVSTRLDITWEKELVRIGASPALIEALKSGKQSKAAEILLAVKNGTYEPSNEEKRRRQEIINQEEPGAINPLMSEEKRAQWRETSQQEQAQRVAQRQREAAERAQLEQRKVEIVVVPAQHQSEFLTPSEKIAAAKAAGVAKAEARRRYCEDHPVECETLTAAQQARSDAEQARSEAQQAHSDLESLKTQLWFDGVKP